MIMRPLIASTLMALGIATSEAAESDFWNVSSELAQCVHENAGVYLASEQPVVMIFVKACPEPDPLKAMNALTKNSAVPSIGVGTEDSIFDDIIIYTRDEIECLSKQSFDYSGTVTRLPKKPIC